MLSIERKNIEIALGSYIGPVDAGLWIYLEMVLGRRLTEVDRRVILRDYLGHKAV